MISVLILTRNEERDLDACLESVSWSDDVFVFDSFSTDATAEIARRRHAHLVQRRFDGYASQRNAALTELPFRHGWIFILDADERPTPELSREMRQRAANASPDTAGFRLRRRDFLYGTWLRHAQISPYYIRLVRLGRARYVREVNEVLEVDGQIEQLQAPLDHFPFSKGIAHWLDKHNVYSTMEARIVAGGLSKQDASLATAIFGRDFHARRRAQKAIFYRLPARPLLKWAMMMFGRGAILDGRAGVVYSTLQSIYEYFIVLKTRELERGPNRALDGAPERGPEHVRERGPERGQDS
jgi:glycosyltransferase involved in cell wall biosynthesis